MKVKVISRDPDKYIRETKKDIQKTFRNYDPDLHPFQSGREYVRALNATKLERVFAKPFVGNLDGHKDGVVVLSKHPNKLSTLASGSYDGEVKIWSVPNKSCLVSIDAHSGYCRGIAFSSDGMRVITIGDDKKIKTWDYTKELEEDESPKPMNMIIAKGVLASLSHSYGEPYFVTSGDSCHIWDESRNEPLKELKWGVSLLHDVKYNPIEAPLLAACAADRGITLYDQREGQPVRKVVMTLRSNQLSWNPMVAFFFTVANDDNNLYTYDTRYLTSPVRIHSGHVDSVTSVDYAPTGEEFVSGSYDKTIRIFNATKANSREIYHTKRMQHVTCVSWSMDNKYVFSGSDEMNVRIWKANAAEKLGALKMREKNAFNYNATLKEKYAAHPEIQRIATHRQVPKFVYNERNKLKTMHQKEKRKEQNRRQNSKPGTVPYVPATKKKIVKTEH